jgi:hypothetical protein
MPPPPHPQFNVVWMTKKRKFNPLFPTLIMGAGGRPTYFKMAKNVKSLIIGRLLRPDIVHFRSACGGTEIFLRELAL